MVVDLQARLPPWLTRFRCVDCSCITRSASDLSLGHFEPRSCAFGGLSVEDIRPFPSEGCRCLRMGVFARNNSTTRRRSDDQSWIKDQRYNSPARFLLANQNFAAFRFALFCSVANSICAMMCTLAHIASWVLAHVVAIDVRGPPPTYDQRDTRMSSHRSNCVDVHDV